MNPDPQRPPSPSSGAARMEKIVSLCKRRGFIFQSSEIYGGLNGCLGYGPLGGGLKRNVKEYWWRGMGRGRGGVGGMGRAVPVSRAGWETRGAGGKVTGPTV